MGIEALPKSTVRAIGATQVLNDPTSAIKELIDNALDAKSTSISIEIHSNTLNSIQVRDNGHGIPPEDRLLVARPHCTSKISGEEDLLAIGGSCLGFRGEALASAAEMSGSLIISTRVEGEEVASSLQINQQGEVIGQSRASLPVGTTVKITDFIKAHPVRRQVAFKNSEKTVGKIKQMLKAYAFARPHVRLSLRVLKAKNDKGNWTYAPKIGGNAEDAAFKLVGATCASQCTWSVIEDHGYMLQAFLPTQDGEVGKYSNFGPFISIDGRPISAARGTPKQILKIFREALKNLNPRAEGVKDPFLFLAIKCPSATYDANVEPAKDDVLFEDPDKLMALVRRLFEEVYPSPETAVSVERAEQPENVPSQMLPNRVDEDDFIASLEPAALGGFRERTVAPWTPFPTDGVLPFIEDQDSGLLPRRRYRSNMYSCDEEDVELVDERPASRHTEAERQELRQACQDVSVSNPWILAKMNATVRRQHFLDDDENVVHVSDTPQVQRNDQALEAKTRDILPTPGPSSPIKAGGNLFGSSMTVDQRRGDGHLMGSRSLPSPEPSIIPHLPDDVDTYVEIPALQRQQTPAYNYNPPSQLDVQPSGTPLHMIPDASQERRQGLKKSKNRPSATAPFKPPVQDQSAREKVWFDHLENMDQSQSLRRPYQARDNNGLVVQGELGDLVNDPRPLTPPRRNRDVRDFFTSGAQAGNQSITDLIDTRQYPQQKRGRSGSGQESLMQDVDSEPQERLTRESDARGFVRASELTTLEHFGPLKPDTSRTTKRRKTSEKRALREISGNATVQDEAIDDEHETNVNGRAASMRPRTTDGSPSKSRRTKSSHLPLERVPRGQATQNVVLELSKTMREISGIAGKIDKERSLLAWNETSLGAYNVFATPFEPAAVEDITANLQTLLASHVPDGEMAQDLGVVVKGVLAAHSQEVLETAMEM